MATEEYLLRFLEKGRRYEDLPPRFKQTLSEEEWRRKVKSFCIQRGYSWVASVARSVCPESEYYEELVARCRARRRLFPYHLSEYVCRVMRLTAFAYYVEMLTEVMLGDEAFDALPNFTAADVVRVAGVGRNEYIAAMQEAKGKRLMWRLAQRAAARDCLPQRPRPPAPRPWWLAQVVNLTEGEHRRLTPAEAAVCEAAARPGGASVAALGGEAALPVLAALHARGLVWFDVPVQPGDRVRVPPLEGFVSNRSARKGEEDALEGLLYSVLVAASDAASVARLAAVLGVDLPTLRVALSMACRLGFCEKIEDDRSGAGEGSNGEQPSGEGGGGRLERAPSSPRRSTDESAYSLSLTAAASSGFDTVVRTPTEPAPLATPVTTAAPPLADARSVAIVVDSQVTGFLMMGALTPACKRHSVTLFEGGRVSGAAETAELARELAASAEAGRGFEGEMRFLAGYASSLATLMRCVAAAAGAAGPLELLRQESLAALAPAAAHRVLAASYRALVPVSGARPPLLPCSLARPGPVGFGDDRLSCTPWLQLALLRALGADEALPALVLPAGLCLKRLPRLAARDGGRDLMQVDRHYAVWPWSTEGLKDAALPLVVFEDELLATLNELLLVTPVLVQSLEGVEAPAAAAPGSVQQVYQIAQVVELPLPDAEGVPVEEAMGALRVVPPNAGNSVETGNWDNAGNDDGSGWSDFEIQFEPEAPAAEAGPAPATPQHVGAQRRDSDRPFGDAAAGEDEAGAGEDDARLGSARRAVSRSTASTPGPVPSFTAAGIAPRSEAATEVQAYRLGESAEAEVCSIELSSSVVKALASLGLLGQLGTLRLVKKAGGWVPLSVHLGVPLQPPELCATVCDQATRRAFLSDAGLAAQRWRNAVRTARLEDLVCEAGTPRPGSGAGLDADLDPSVDWPYRPMLLRGGETLGLAALGCFGGPTM